MFVEKETICVIPEEHIIIGNRRQKRNFDEIKLFCETAFEDGKIAVATDKETYDKMKKEECSFYNGFKRMNNSLDFVHVYTGNDCFSISTQNFCL